MFSSTNLNAAMRNICSHMQIPVIVILLLFCAVTLVIIGTLITEIFMERRHVKVWVPKLADELRKESVSPDKIIYKSRLLKRQKIALIELTKHDDFSATMREALAVRLVQEERARYDSIIKLSDLIVKLGPAAGLLGTLIPLGPGIIAMGQGDTYTLSQSLMVAFDTTILGLSCGCLNTVISTIRKKWYTNDISILETLMECVLEIEKSSVVKVSESNTEEEPFLLDKKINLETEVQMQRVLEVERANA